MKKIVIILLFLPLIGLGQVSRNTLAEIKIGTVTCKYVRSIDVEIKDTTDFVYFAFRNQEYSHITDNKIILFEVTNDVSELLEFVEVLKLALPEMGKKSTIEWKKEKYRIDLFEFSPRLYLTSLMDIPSGSTQITSKNVEKMIKWVEDRGFKE